MSPPGSWPAHTVRDSALLRELSPTELEMLRHSMSVQPFHAGDAVMTAGEPATYVAVVLSGTLKAKIPRTERVPRAAANPYPKPNPNPNPNPHPNPKAGGGPSLLQEWRLLETGAVVGEMALFGGMVRTTTVEAITAGELGVLRFSDFGEWSACMRLIDCDAIATRLRRDRVAIVTRLRRDCGTVATGLPRDCHVVAA